MAKQEPSLAHGGKPGEQWALPWQQQGKTGVVVVGNVGIDTCVYGQHDAGKETHFSKNLDFIGQAGAYCARGFQRLGHATSFIGHVGNDPWGRQIRATFEEEGIDLRALGTDPEGTARSINLMASDGSRVNYYDGKGHMHLEADVPLARQVMKGAGLAHFHLANWARTLLKPARQEGLCVSCDLQDVREISDPYRQDFIEAADIIFFSAANIGEVEVAIQECFRRSKAQVVIVGMGKDGCAYATRQGISYLAAADHEHPVVDTNGAGDGLAVGFLSAYVLEGRPLTEAIKRGSRLARHTCTLQTGSDDLITAQALGEYSS